MPTKQWKRTLAAGLILGGSCQAALAQTPVPPPVVLPDPAPPAALPPGHPTQLGHVRPAAGPAYPCVRRQPPFWTRFKYTLEDCLLGRPEEFDAPPLGSAVGLHYETHVANGVAARMALYDYDFVRGTDRLNVRGRDRVRQLAALLGHNQFPVVVERTPHSPGLAEARRQAVLAEMAAVLPRVPAERVVVGAPVGVPLNGVEAELIYQNLLLQTGTAGALPGTGAGPGSATTTPGGAGAPPGAVSPGR